MEKIKEMLEDRRYALRWTYTKIAEMTGLNYNTVRRFMQESSGGELYTAVLIAEALGCELRLVVTK